MMLLVAILFGWSHAAEATKEPIALSRAVSVGNADLYLEIRGDDPDAPILLWLHGGPGGAERPLFRYFDSDLEKHFIVVYLDQRGAGNSYDASADTRELTVSQHIRDLDRVIDDLLARYRRERLMLIGHSWGGTLGLLYAQAHPLKISALIAVAPSIAYQTQWRREYDWALSEARRSGDQEALRELNRIGEPPYGASRQVLDLQRVTQRFRGVEYREHSHAMIAVSGLLRGLVSPPEILRIIRGNNSSLEAMHAELSQLDLRKTVGSIDVPVAFFLGRHDHHVSSTLAAEYLDMLKAPAKLMYWFEQSAHDVPFDEPDIFVRCVAEAAERLASRPERQQGNRSCAVAQ
jgi:pimeloyl-ACP methyl ester carboxylesterase